MTSDLWAAGDRYEPYVGRWSRRVAPRFVRWLERPGGLRWADVGCGTGALTAAIVEEAAPASVLGIDPSEAFVRYAQAHAPPAAAFRVGDAMALPLADRSVDAAVGGLMLNFVPDPEAALLEMARVTTSDGAVGVYVWDYAGRMELMRAFWDAAAALDASATRLDEGRLFPICSPEPLRELFQGAGLADVRVDAIDVDTTFADFDDYWVPFLGATGPAPAYAMSLTDDRRDALRERLRETLPIAPDGTIPLVARAWACSGRVA